MVGSTLLAEDLKPPVPPPAGDNADLLPPPIDLTQMTPLPLPANSNAESATDSGTLVPTAIPVKASEKKKEAAPVSSIAAEAPLPPTAEKSDTSAPAASLGLFAEYFPMAKGSKWSYEYLKAEPGSKSKKTRTVECTDQTQMPNGGIQATLETTEDGQSTKDSYSLSDNQVEHLASDDQAISGDFVFKLPPAGGASSWSATEKNGTIHKSKASFGKAQVYRKIYHDCVIVTEKVVKGGKTTNTVIYYYAKGIGLVAIEVYSPAMKLSQTKSIALVSGPAGSV